MHVPTPSFGSPRLDADDPRTDAEIIEGVLAGETRLFEVLMRRHNQRLYRAVRAHIRDDTEVEEIMQDSYLSAFQHLATFEGRAKFSTWLLQIGINRARQSLRARARWATGPLPAESPAPERDPERTAAAHELLALLERSIDALPAASRAALVLRDVEGLETWEVAEALNVSKEAVRVRLHRARGELRRRLREDLGALTPAAFRFYVPRCDRVVAAVLPATEGGR